MSANAADEKLERRIREADLDRDLFLAPRRCMREPIPEIFQAVHLLDRAMDALRMAIFRDLIWRPTTVLRIWSRWWRGPVAIGCAVACQRKRRLRFSRVA